MHDARPVLEEALLPVVQVRPTSTVMDAAGALAMAREVDEALGRGAGLVEIDLGEVSWINSTVIGILVARERRARRSGGRIVLKNLRPEVSRVLETLGATRIFTS
jgi:anti-anti-sigma factor